MSALRLALLGFVFASIGCGGATQPVENGAASSSDPDALVLTLTPGDFAYCECHHGYGAGVDGSLDLAIHNPSSRDRTVSDAAFSLEGARATYRAQRPGLRLVPEEHRFMNDGSVPSLTVAAGATVHVMITAYIDGPNGYDDVAGRRRVRLEMHETSKLVSAEADVTVVNSGRH